MYVFYSKKKHLIYEFFCLIEPTTSSILDNPSPLEQTQWLISYDIIFFNLEAQNLDTLTQIKKL
jgi:hypothetical protein